MSESWYPGCERKEHPLAAIKTLGSEGQIALGERYAGQQVMVDETEPGVWVIKTGKFIPRSEHWLHEPEAAASIDRGLRWVAENPPARTDLEVLRRRIEE
jgi:hypothetical protein